MKPEIGIIPALLTPLKEDETIDLESLESLLEWILESGVAGIFVAGTMGEGIRRIMALPRLEGLKYSGSDFALFEKCLKELSGDHLYFNGNVPQIAASAKIGGGAISGIGSLLPGLCIRVFEAGLKGDEEEAARLQKAIESVYAIYGPAGWPYWPSAQKYVLMKRGIIKTCCVTHPFLQLGPKERSEIDRALEKIEDWVFHPAPAPDRVPTSP